LKIGKKPYFHRIFHPGPKDLGFNENNLSNPQPAKNQLYFLIRTQEKNKGNKVGCLWGAIYYYEKVVMFRKIREK